MKQYTFIVNPEAGRGHGRKLLEPLENELKARNVDFEILVTTRAGEAVDFARNGAGPNVVSVGGDGTLNEVANGVVGRNRTVGIIPAGSGNDFIKSLNVPRRLSDALNLIFSGRTRNVDVGVITCTARSRSNRTLECRDRIFVNGVGVGFDAEVAARMRNIKFLSGTPVYVLAVLQTLGKYEAPRFRIMVDGAKQTSRNLLIAIGNGQCAGGSFYLTPNAVVDDGQLDICFIEDVGVLKILRLMPFVMVGRHGRIREVSFARSRDTISIEAADSFSVHADGEVVGQEVNAVQIRVRPRNLQILAV